MMQKLKMHSHDFAQENVAKLADLFPGCVTESTGEDGKPKKSIDFDLLRQELSTAIVEGPQERYHLNWPGKLKSLLIANDPIAKTLRPSREESVEFDTTGNLFIEGNNLFVLKLLQETYLGKVKMIYIDPPYNTGKDFIYVDNFAQSTEEYLLNSGQKDEEGNRLIANTDSNGRFHSDWLSMMYSRLKLARNLLKDDGCIFISIGDDEIHNLKKICCEIFGEKNFITEFCWERKKKPSFLNKNIGSKFEYIICFSKNREYTKEFSVELTEKGKKYPFNNAGNSISTLTFPPGSVYFKMKNKTIPPQDMSKGKIITELLSELIIKDNKNLNVFELRGEWRYSQSKLDEIIKNKEMIVISKIPFRPNNIKAGGEIKKMHNLLTIKHYSVETNEDADSQLSDIFGVSIFDYAKPTGLIKLFIKAFMYDDKESIVLDFFAGSATTAHAVMQLNAEDGGKRKFIMVQLPEACDKKSEAFRCGYKTIAEISKERIRRAGKKIKEELTTKDPKGTKEEDGNLFSKADKETFREVPAFRGSKDLDIGFRVLKVDSSNMVNKKTPDEIEQSDLLSCTENIKDDRTSEDLLFQVLLDRGVDLTLPITRETIGGREVFFVDRGNALAACFEKAGLITEDFCKELAGRGVLRVVFRDAGFKDDSVRINVEQIFKLISPDTDVKII